MAWLWEVWKSGLSKSDYKRVVVTNQSRLLYGDLYCTYLSVLSYGVK